MPATYAHWAFGRDCIEKMPDNLKEIINQHRDIYDLGVHGPDILFYNLLHPNILKYGYEMHYIPAKEFFKTSKRAFNEHEQKAEMLAYLMGFLTHFVLDSSCHSYVERKIEESTASHNKIESQWERHIIELDHRAPNLVDRAESLRPNKNNALIISYFFPYNSKQILHSCKMQRYIVEKLNSISHKKEDRLKKLLKRINKDDYADLFIGFTEDEECLDSNLRLDKLRVLALKRFPKLMKNFLNYLNGKEELDKYFEHNFSIWQDYKDIQVLPYKKEINYKVK